MMKLILNRLVAMFVILTVSPYGVTAKAGDLAVPVMERSQGNLDTCAFGSVSGLQAGGDGFLAVRAGPGTKYEKIDELKNADKVWLFDQKGDWIGIIYGVEELSCSPIQSERVVPHKGKKGWVHENWIKLIAG